MRPWYRERWPWILMSGPATVLVAGAATMWIAFASADGVVAGDYYKRGLAINQDLQREQRAEQRSIGAPSRVARLVGALPERERALCCEMDLGVALVNGARVLR